MIKNVLTIGLVAASSNYYFMPKKRPPKIEFNYNPTIEQVVRREAIINNLRPEFLYGIIAQESGFNAIALSNTNNEGCGQLGAHARKVVGLTKEENLVCENSISGAARYIGVYGVQETGTNDEETLARWNYCGINLLGKRIYDKLYKKLEFCGDSYVNKLKKRGNAIRTKSESVRRQDTKPQRTIIKVG